MEQVPKTKIFNGDWCTIEFDEDKKLAVPSDAFGNQNRGQIPDILNRLIKEKPATTLVKN